MYKYICRGCKYAEPCVLFIETKSKPEVCVYEGDDVLWKECEIEMTKKEIKKLYERG